MTRIFYTLAEMITPLLLMPIIIGCYGIKKHYAFDRIIICLLFSLYLAAVFHLTGQPDLVYHRFEPNIYLIPFGEIISDFRNSILNILFFVPLGFFLPVLGEKYRRAVNTLLFGLCMTLTVELLQMFTLRATDINDVITNVIGTLLGWLMWYGMHGKTLCLNQKDRGRDILFCCASTYSVMFFIQPFTYRFLWKLVFG